MTFNRFYVGSKYPYFISYRDKWLYLFCRGCILFLESPLRLAFFDIITIVILFSKLIPLLRDHGIHNLDNRKEWPLSVMRQVLFELMEETPKDLLSMNLYLSSKTADEWYQLTSNLTRSIAVMCVIGYIIGKKTF